MRFFYKDENGAIFEYGSEEERNQYGPEGLVALTPSEVDAHLSPPLTYKQALDALNATYQADVAKLNNAFALTLLADGPTEATKMATIRSRYEARKTQHAADLEALKIEKRIQL